MEQSMETVDEQTQVDNNNVRHPIYNTWLFLGRAPERKFET